MNHLKRLSWPILIFLVCVLVASRVGMSQANFEVIIFKYLIFCPSVVLVHLSRKQLFPYVDMAVVVYVAGRYVDISRTAIKTTIEHSQQVNN